VRGVYNFILGVFIIILMDIDLDNVFEVVEIRALISHKKNLLEFFNELIKLKNLRINDTSSDEDCEDEGDSLYSDDSDYD